jgi:hypothetical protein
MVLREPSVRSRNGEERLIGRDGEERLSTSN